MTTFQLAEDSLTSKNWNQSNTNNSHGGSGVAFDCLDVNKDSFLWFHLTRCTWKYFEHQTDWETLCVRVCVSAGANTLLWNHTGSKCWKEDVACGHFSWLHWWKKSVCNKDLFFCLDVKSIKHCSTDIPYLTVLSVKSLKYYMMCLCLCVIRSLTYRNVEHLFGQLNPCYSTYTTPTRQTGTLQTALCFSSFAQDFFKRLNVECVGSDRKQRRLNYYTSDVNLRLVPWP